MTEKKRVKKEKRCRLHLSVTLQARIVEDIKQISQILGIPQSRIVEVCLKHGEKGLEVLKEAAKVLQEGSEKK